jgi:hypothetical protein
MLLNRIKGDIMRKRVALAGMITALLITSPLIYAASATAGADEDYITIHGAVNDHFIETISKNRSSTGDKTADYMDIDGNEEFQKALESGKLDSDLEDSSSIRKRYIYRNIENVDLDDRDLEGMDGDTLNLGSDVEGGNVVQSLNIKDSTIDTDKHINAGVTSSSGDADDITNITNIEDSKLSGGSSDDDKGISTSKFFD